MSPNNFKIDFVGIGAARAATTWIFDCLKEHPQICGSSIKELYFFSETQNYNQGLKFYASYFKHCPKNKIKGEISIDYLFKEEAPARIKKHFPEVKLIVSLRNPIERAYSHYLHNKMKELRRTSETSGKLSKEINKLTPESFEKSLKQGIENEHIKRGLYYSQLKRYLKLFPKENILILIYEDIAQDPLKFIQGIYKFLGVDPDFVPSKINQKSNWLATNPSRLPLIRVAFSKTKRALTNKRIFAPMLVLGKKTGLSKLIYLALKLNNRRKGITEFRKQPISEKTRKYLRQIFREDIKKLEGLINRDLNFWK